MEAITYESLRWKYLGRGCNIGVGIGVVKVSDESSYGSPDLSIIQIVIYGKRLVRKNGL